MNIKSQMLESDFKFRISSVVLLFRRWKKTCLLTVYFFQRFINQRRSKNWQWLW